MNKKTRLYSKEFKQDAVDYYYSSQKTIKATELDLGISASGLTGWINSGLMSRKKTS